jgi:hypothetical protein
VAWTKPADLVFDPDKDLPKLGGLLKDGRFSVMSGDGWVMVAKVDGESDEAIFRKALIRNSGEIRNLGDLAVP